MSAVEAMRLPEQVDLSGFIALLQRLQDLVVEPTRGHDADPGVGAAHIERGAQEAHPVAQRGIELAVRLSEASLDNPMLVPVVLRLLGRAARVVPAVFTQVRLAA